MLKKNECAGLINGPISKRHFLSGNFPGITEYLAKELSYISQYAQHKARVLEEELWSVVCVGEMIEITDSLYKVRKKILTSATHEVSIPSFIGLQQPIYINYLEDGIEQLKVKTILSPTKLKSLTVKS